METGLTWDITHATDRCDFVSIGLVLPFVFLFCRFSPSALFLTSLLMRSIEWKNLKWCPIYNAHTHTNYHITCIFPLFLLIIIVDSNFWFWEKIIKQQRHDMFYHRFWLIFPAISIPSISFYFYVSKALHPIKRIQNTSGTPWIFLLTPNFVFILQTSISMIIKPSSLEHTEINCSILDGNQNAAIFLSVETFYCQNLNFSI